MRLLKMIDKITIPEYFKYMKSDAKLNASEVCEIFGYSDHKNVAKYVNDGKLPKPDIDGKIVSNLHDSKIRTSGKNKMFWNKDTIIQQILNYNNGI